MGLQVGGPLSLIHRCHSVGVFLEEDDQGSLREEVRDLIRNITTNDACGQGCKGFSTSVIGCNLSEVLHPLTILMGGREGGGSIN